MQAPHASEADVDAAVASAKEAFAGWAATPIEERKAIMLKAHDALAAHSEELLELLVTEQGKPMDAAEAEFNLSLDNIKMHATEFELPVEDLGTNETHKTVVLRKPVGVVAGITPCAPFPRSPRRRPLTRSAQVELPDLLRRAEVGPRDHLRQLLRPQAQPHDPDDLAPHRSAFPCPCPLLRTGSVL